MMPQVTDAFQQSSPCLTATNIKCIPNLTASVNCTWCVAVVVFSPNHLKFIHSQEMRSDKESKWFLSSPPCSRSLWLCSRGLWSHFMSQPMSMFLLWRDATKCLQLILEHGSQCSRFTSWINITCLEAALCSSISLSLDSSHSDHSSCILSIVLLPLICKGYRLDVGQWRYRHAGWRTQWSPAALSALLSPWWPIHTGLQVSTPLPCATFSAVCDARVRVECWQYELIGIPNTSC